MTLTLGTNGAELSQSIPAPAGILRNVSIFMDNLTLHPTYDWAEAQIAVDDTSYPRRQANLVAGYIAAQAGLRWDGKIDLDGSEHLRLAGRSLSGTVIRATFNLEII